MNGAPHLFSSNRYECPLSMALCESSTSEANYHLCCQRIQGLPECPNLNGQHSSQSYTGNGINSLGVPCTAPIGDGILCPPGKIYLPGPKCCISKGLSSSMHSFPQFDNIYNNNICQDRAVPGRKSDCPENKHLCNNSIYFDLMTIQCPVTCDRCGQIPSNAVIYNANIPELIGCFDRVGPNGKSDCPQRKAYCTLPIWDIFLRFECPFTCGICGGNLKVNLFNSTNIIGENLK
ncbi:ShKT domain-containing protein [Meloidogyne graminicola]|uniref:ShKT domain-containing protein n=1 Tax=Meloidogyne graminicola TaxID=189291 RepID=A0A8S9ZRZ7_9BILA|nr:ShKT domain-containing protein [Meloidogyne graminicola]